MVVISVHLLRGVCPLCDLGFPLDDPLGSTIFSGSPGNCGGHACFLLFTLCQRLLPILSDMVLATVNQVLS